MCGMHDSAVELIPKLIKSRMIWWRCASIAFHSNVFALECGTEMQVKGVDAPFAAFHNSLCVLRAIDLTKGDNI